MRILGQNTELPTGGSSEFDPGIGASARLDHVHTMWEKWETIPTLSGWTTLRDLEFCRAGNLVMLRGIVTNPDPGSPANNVIAVLPEGVRPIAKQLFWTLENPGPGFPTTDLIGVVIEPTGNILKVIHWGGGPLPVGFGTIILFNEIIFRND